MTGGTVPHPFVGYVIPPEVGADPGFKSFHRNGVTGLGFIDSGSTLRKRDPGRFILAVTGGSVAYWLSVHGSAALERELAPALGGRRLEIVRLAMGGFKQPQQLLALTWVLSLGGEVDAVVNLDGFNEVAIYPAELESAGVFPGFPRAWSAMLSGVQSSDVTLVAGKVGLYRDLRRRWASLLDGAPGRIHLGALLWVGGDAVLAGREAFAEKALREKTAGRGYAALGPERRFDGASERTRYLVSLWAASSTQMARLCAGNGVPYLHVLQPNQYVAGSKPMSEEERRIAIRPDEPYRPGAEAGYPLMIEAGRELVRSGVPFHDLTGLFSKVQEPTYADSCCHLNQLGNEILGTEIGRLLGVEVAHPTGSDRPPARVSSRFVSALPQGGR